MCRRFTMLTFPETLEVIRCLDRQEPCTMTPSWPLDKPLERSTSIYPPLSRDPLERAGKKPRTDALPEAGLTSSWRAVPIQPISNCPIPKSIPMANGALALMKQTFSVDLKASLTQQTKRKTPRFACPTRKAALQPRRLPGDLSDHVKRGFSTTRALSLPFPHLYGAMPPNTADALFLHGASSKRMRAHTASACTNSASNARSIIFTSSLAP